MKQIVSVVGLITLRWIGAGGYDVYRQPGSCFSAGAKVASVTKGRYTDAPKTEGFYCYHVVARGGVGVQSGTVGVNVTDMSQTVVLTIKEVR
jgi:hypothetical protein